MVRHTRSLNWAIQRRLSGVQRRLNQGSNVAPMGYPASFSRGIQRRSSYRSSVVCISSVFPVIRVFLVNIGTGLI